MVCFDQLPLNAVSVIKIVFFCFSLEPIYKTSCALTIHAIGRYSPDVLKNHAKEVLPLAFLGMHEIADEEKAEKEECNLWTEVWQENVPG